VYNSLRQVRKIQSHVSLVCVRSSFESKFMFMSCDTIRNGAVHVRLTCEVYTLLNATKTTVCSQHQSTHQTLDEYVMHRVRNTRIACEKWAAGTGICRSFVWVHASNLPAGNTRTQFFCSTSNQSRPEELLEERKLPVRQPRRSCCLPGDTRHRSMQRNCASHPDG